MRINSISGERGDFVTEKEQAGMLLGCWQYSVSCPGMWWKVKVLATQSCPILCDCSPPSSSVQGILQARILEWVAIPFSRGSSWPRDRAWVSCLACSFFTVWATGEAVTVFFVIHSWHLFFFHAFFFCLCAVLYNKVRKKCKAVMLIFKRTILWVLLRLM